VVLIVQSVMVYVAQLATKLMFYDPPSRRTLEWRKDCVCVGDISSYQDGQ